MPKKLPVQTEFDKEKQRKEKEKEEFNKRQEELDLKYKKAAQESRFRALLSKLKFETYTKRLVAVIVGFSIIDLQLSYVLAFLDKYQIAESLSTQICITLLGTILVYVIRAYFDTKAEKHNELIKDGYIDGNSKKLSVVSTEAIQAVVDDVISKSGLSVHIKDGEGGITAVPISEPENPSDASVG